MGEVSRNEEKKKKRRRNRGRKRRGLPALTSVKQMDLKEENEEMRAKLADRLSKDKPKSDGGKVEDRLAKLAGIKQMDDEDNDAKDDEEHESDEQSDGYDSDSGDDEEGGGNKVIGKMRSDEVEVDIRDKEVKDKEKWKHDKFDPAQDDKKKVNKFGKHWNSPSLKKHWNTRRERSKGRSRSRSRRRSRSSGDRSSRSRSRNRGVKRKRRRRGKFSKSRSRSSSSSESSRSRSKSRRRRSRSSRSRTRASSSRPRSRISDMKTAGGSKESKKDTVDEENVAEKEGVNLELSGALTADSNTVNGTVVKYSEPTEARKPKKKWRLYVFKGSEELPILYIHRQSAYLLGRDRKVADIPLDHPSCSKQHAVLQYRLVPFTRGDKSEGKRVQLYVMDLNSANGTFVNNNKIESQKYVQLLEKDVLKFGFSSREYVLLHDQSKEAEEEDPGVD